MKAPTCEECDALLEAGDEGGREDRYLRCPSCGFIWGVPGMASYEEWNAAAYPEPTP